MARQRAVLFGTVAALLLAIVVLLVLSTRQRAREGARNLDSILVFADPARCLPSEPLERLLRSMPVVDPESLESGQSRADVRVDAGPPIAIPGFAAPLRPRLRRYPRSDELGYYSHYAFLDLRGRWHGLKVMGVEGDPTQFRIRFDEPVERVRAVLLAAGFGSAPSDHSPEPEQFIAIQRHRDGGTVLWCTHPWRDH